MFIVYMTTSRTSCLSLSYANNMPSPTSGLRNLEVLTHFRAVFTRNDAVRCIANHSTDHAVTNVALGCIVTIFPPPHCAQGINPPSSPRIIRPHTPTIHPQVLNSASTAVMSCPHSVHRSSHVPNRPLAIPTVSFQRPKCLPRQPTIPTFPQGRPAIHSPFNVY